MARLERAALIGRLDPIRYDRDQGQQDAMEQMSFGGALLTLTELDHDREYALCHRVARHLLGKLNEPEDVVVE